MINDISTDSYEITCIQSRYANSVVTMKGSNSFLCDFNGVNSCQPGDTANDDKKWHN
jgi:hypothetical protein